MFYGGVSGPNIERLLYAATYNVGFQCPQKNEESGRGREDITTFQEAAASRSGESPMSVALTTTHENGFSLPRHRAEVETHSKRLGVRSLFTWCRAPAEELDPDIRTRDFQRRSL
jgi:hypothetical protein